MILLQLCFNAPLDNLQLVIINLLGFRKNDCERQVERAGIKDVIFGDRYDTDTCIHENYAIVGVMTANAPDHSLHVSLITCNIDESQEF